MCREEDVYTFEVGPGITYNSAVAMILTAVGMGLIHVVSFVVRWYQYLRPVRGSLTSFQGINGGFERSSSSSILQRIPGRVFRLTAAYIYLFVTCCLCSPTA